MPEIELKDVAKSVEAVNVAFNEFKAANDERLKELATKGAVDTLIEEKLGRIDDAMNKHQEQLDAVVLQVKRKSTKVVDEHGNEIDLDAKAAEWIKGVAGKRQEVAPANFGAKEMDGYKSAFLRFARKGEAALSVDETKALSVGSDPDGGYTVYPDMSGRITMRVFETSPMRAYASVQVIGTDALEGLIDNDEADAGWVGETATRSETDTPEIGRYRIPVHELQASPRATQKLLDDSSINMEAWLAGKVADKFARVENAAFVTGDGVGKPRGITTYADWTTAGTFEHGKIEQFDTGANGAFAAAPNGGDVLFTAIYGTKAAYRANAVFFTNRAVLSAARKLKDSDGAYIWQPGIAAGQPSTLAGYPVASFEDMPALGTGSLSLGFGDLREAYQIVDRIGLRILRDPYTAKPYVIFYTTKRVGGDVVNFDAVKLINFKS